LRRLDAGGGCGWVDGRNRFPGLRPFGPDLRRVFFGRHGEVEDLTELLRSAGDPGDRRVVVLTRPSGCGKSSLVRAGLIPAIADEPGWWTLPAVLPGVDPIAAITRGITGESRRLGLNWQLPQILARLDIGDVRDVLDELLVEAPGQPERLLIVIDQLEELLTLTAGTDRQRFVGVLRAALAGPILVGTLRPEFLGSLLADPALGTLRPRSYLVRPLDHDCAAGGDTGSGGSCRHSRRSGSADPAGHRYRRRRAAAAPRSPCNNSPPTSPAMGTCH